MRRDVLLGVCVLGAFVLGACASAGSGGPPDGGGGGSADAPIGTADAAIDAALMTCAGTDTCQGAMMLGTVNGDSGNQKVMAMGHRGAWFRVRVNENNGDPFGVALRVAAKLTSPATPMFDVFVYVNTGNDVVECATSTGTVSTNGNTKQVRAEWGEGTISNGSDDGRNVSIEVRPLATSGCSPGAMWQLEVEGNWN